MRPSGLKARLSFSWWSCKPLTALPALALFIWEGSGGKMGFR